MKLSWIVNKNCLAYALANVEIQFNALASFQKEISKFPSVKNHKKELSEDRIDDILENICNDEWTQYGIKQVDGINRLSGPGFETNDIPGVMQGGGKWPFRLV